MSSSKHQPVHQFDLSGGNLALDFANTISHRDNPETRAEHLQSYPDLVAFASQSKLLPHALAEDLRSHAPRRSGEARRVFREAIHLRESMYRAFSAMVDGKVPAHGDVQRIGDAALEALRHRRLARRNGGYRWEWPDEVPGKLHRLLWPIAESAADLLTSHEVSSIRLCEAPDCDWLFLDNSRNRSRRWCDMKICGNREKARRHYRRSRT